MTANIKKVITGAKSRKLREAFDSKYMGVSIFLVFEKEKNYSFECGLDYMKSSQRIQFMKYDGYKNELEIFVDVVNSFPETEKLYIRRILSKIIEIKI